MKRRHSSAVGVSLLIAAMLLPAPVAAKSPSGTRSADGIGHPAFDLKKFDASKLPSLSRGTARHQLFIQLSGRPVTSYQASQLATAGTKLSEADKATIRARLARQQGQLRGRIGAIGARVQSSFTDVANGFRVSATIAQARQIARLSGVTQVTAVPLAKRADLSSADYIDAISAWTSSGYTGAGVKIAVIDSGINYYHKNFGGTANPGFNNDNPKKVEPGTFPTAKVVGGYDFVGDNYDPEGVFGTPTPKPDKDPLDCKAANSDNVQHGSHVAGIAAGFGVKSNGSTYTGAYTAAAVNSTSFRVGPGIAPRASLYAYRVLSCGGGTFVLADAIERAVRDNVDVINMSLGSDLGNPYTIDGIASNAAAEAGVVVVASAGNSGSSAYVTGSPAVAERVISVGAVDGSLFLSQGVIVDFPGAATDVGGWNMYETPLPVTGPMNVILTGPATFSNGCALADYSGVSAGDIVAIRRGDCDFSAKRGMAQDAGAVGMVLVNNADETVVNPVPDPSTIPVISVNPAFGADIIAGDGLMTTLHVGNVTNENYGSPASFTSAGPARFSNMVKPDLMAPGVDVVSTDGATVKGGKSLGGTSMAAPQTAGAAALVLQAHPTWTTAHVKGVLVGASDPNMVDPYTVRRGGAGVINANRATKAVSWAESLDFPGSSSLTFGYEPIRIDRDGGDAYTETRSFRLQNTSNAAITYDLSNDQQTLDWDVVVSMPASVTVPAKSTRIVNVTLSLSNADAAALPEVAPFDAPVFAIDGPSIYVPLLNVAGAILADPTTSGTGHSTVRIPWLVVPRGTSEIKATQKDAYSGGTIKSSSVPVKNRGVHGGNVDVFAWGLSDQREGQGSIDLRAAGVQSLPTEFCTGVPDPDDRCVIFGINVWEPWQSGADNEYDVIIDIDGDDTPDFLVIGVDYALVFGPGDIEGLPISLILDIRTNPFGDFVDIWFATAAPNSSTILLPVLASEIGRDAAHDRIRYWVESLPSYDGSADPGNPVFQFDAMFSGSEPNLAGVLAKYNVFDNPLSQGDFYSLDPGDHADVPIWVDTSRYHPSVRAQKGWMFVNMDDPGGANQADLVPVGTLQ